MQFIFHALLFSALAVTMVTSAPLTNQEKLVDVAQTGEAVDRAKRADEEIVFGNQQNKARVISKKSDLSNILAAPEPKGERDQGSVVIVHKQAPVHEELAARDQAALGSVSENNEKMKEAVEDAIQSVAETIKSETESNVQEEKEKAHLDEKIIKQIVEEDKDESEQGTGEVSENVEEKIVEDDEDEELRNLQRETSEPVAVEGGRDANEVDNVESTPERKDDVDEVERFLQETHKQNDDGSEVELDRDRERSYYESQMRNYLMSLNNGRDLSYIRPYMPRYRRSLYSPRTYITSAANKKSRRIKRDLLDNGYYTPYDLKNSLYTSNDINDALISDPEESVPLSDEDAEYLYKELVNYLANSYAAEQEEPSLEELPLDSYLNGYEEAQNEPYAPYTIHNEDTAPIVSNPYEVRYPYYPVDIDSYQNYAKRGMIDYYPENEEEKRYFYPFSKEPETHWGAFVPEKRDYGEAIQRLQRLAMALSDNPGPYYREVLEEYRRK
uniref:Uncharacterized protein n=1 Tax=Arion vulgaris TaxID=1028688 RepID=A0A0B7AZM7_9EUPU